MSMYRPTYERTQQIATVSDRRHNSSVGVEIGSEYLR